MFDRHQVRGAGYVPVPEVMMNGLKIPFHFSCGGMKRQMQLPKR